MENSILYPRIPYIGPICGNGEVTPETVIKIEGAILGANTCRFNINFQCGLLPRDNIAVQISTRLLDGRICLNSLRDGIWDEGQSISIVPMGKEELFEIVVRFELDQYKISINDQNFKFPQRIPYANISHLCINGDVSIIKICYEPTAKSTDTNIEVIPIYSPVIDEGTSCWRSTCWRCCAAIISLIICFILVGLKVSTRNRVHTITIPQNNFTIPGPHYKSYHIPASNYDYQGS